ncbi:MAG: metal ABC transporter substrate-binding protein [Planctomycetota bacterium]
MNYPLAYFAERVGGEYVNVVFPAPPDVDPAFWSPNADTVSDYQKADLILLNGASYAKWVPKVTLPSSRLANTSKSAREKFITVEDAITHSHGPGAQHSHEGTAFTVWLDPEIAAAQVTSIEQSLSTLRPELSDRFRRNSESLVSDLKALDQKFRDATSAAPDQPVVFSHPVYQYFQRAYGLNGESVHWEPDTTPTESQWTKLKELLQRHPAKWMIWEGTPLDQSVSELAALGVNSIVLNPCGNVPDQGDWLQVMNRNAEELAQVYAPAKPSP